MALRILHLADTHLGYSAYQRLVPEGERWSGLNQREADVYAAWHAVVEAAVEALPDVVIHAGDLFDSVRPSNRALHEALSGLQQLTKAGIPVVLIAGNHETPRLRETGHVFRLLERFEGLYPIFRGPPEAVVLNGLDDLRVVGVPHSHTGMAEAIGQATPDEQYKNNILVLHGVVSGLKLPSKELNQAEIQSGLLRRAWDYIGLGHYHCFTKVEPNAYYAGSTERFSFAEAKEVKGYALVELPNLKVTPCELPVREFVDLDWLDVAHLQRLKPPLPAQAERPASAVAKVSPAGAKGQLTFDDWGGGVPPETEVAKGSDEPGAPTRTDHSQVNLNSLLQSALRDCQPSGKVVRQKVLNCPPELYRLVDFQALRRLAATAVHYQPQFELAAAGEAVQAPSAAIGPLAQEFGDFLAKQPLEGLDRTRLEGLGLEFLKAAGGGP